MSRIRTIKPDFFKHEDLFDAEQAEGLPLRLAFAGLWTCCDREGRFEWRPRALKTDILPYDEVDFSRVLDALATRGFVVRYASDGREYGYVPGFTRHQVINNKEAQSKLPAPEQGPDKSADLTRGSRVDLASVTPLSNSHGEGEGEGEREEEQNGGGDARARDAGADASQQDLTFRERILVACGVSTSGFTGRGGQMIGRSDEMAEINARMTERRISEAEVLQIVTEAMVQKNAGRDPGPPFSLRFFLSALDRFVAARDAPIPDLPAHVPRAAAPPAPPRIRARLPSEIPPETIQ